MRSSRSSLGLLTTLVAFAALSGAAGCSPSMEAYMGFEAGLGTKKFHDNNEIHCLVNVVGADPDTRVRFNLKAPGNAIELSDDEVYPAPTTKDMGDDHLIDVKFGIEVTSSTGTTTTSSKGPWPKDNYRMVVTLDNGETGEVYDEVELPFEVE